MKDLTLNVIEPVFIRPQIEEFKEKYYTLVVNLDGTLMKASLSNNHDSSQSTFNTLELFVSFRPYLTTFLKELSQYFNLIIWSSSPRDFTNHLFQSFPLDIQSLFDRVYSQEHCIMSQDERLCVKSLAQVNLDLAKTIVIDSSLQNATMNLTNCVWIPHYTQDDNYLKPLGEYLKTFT